MRKSRCGRKIGIICSKTAPLAKDVIIHVMPQMVIVCLNFLVEEMAGYDNRKLKLLDLSVPFTPTGYMRRSEASKR